LSGALVLTDVESSHAVWRGRTESLVGYFPRIHGYKEDGSVFYEMANVHHKYDSEWLRVAHAARRATEYFVIAVILTKAMFISGEL
jgi:hypothetical protein